MFMVVGSIRYPLHNWHVMISLKYLMRLFFIFVRESAADSEF